MKSFRIAFLVSSTVIACTLLIGLLVSAPSAQAQSTFEIGTVDVPFAFQVAGQKIPPGTYRIEHVSEHVVVLRGSNQAPHSTSVHRAVALVAPAKGSVVFHRYGDTYFLGRVWIAGEVEGMECPNSRQEREALQASKQSVASDTQLALNSSPRP